MYLIEGNTLLINPLTLLDYNISSEGSEAEVYIRVVGTIPQQFRVRK